MSAIDRLSQLREVVSAGMTDEDRRDLHATEQRIKQLEDYSVLKARPGIKDLIDWSMRGIREINDQLSTDRDLLKDGHEHERLAMLDRRDILLYFVGLFNPEAELDEIEKYLTDRIVAFSEYRGEPTAG